MPTHRLGSDRESDDSDGRRGDQECIALKITGTLGDAQTGTGVADVATLDEWGQPLRHGDPIRVFDPDGSRRWCRDGRTASTHRL